MRLSHARMLETLTGDMQRRLLSRRGMLAAGGVAAAALVPMVGGYRLASAQDDATPVADPADAEIDVEESPFDSEVDVLNYALTLEHLENAFYRDGVPQFAAADFEAIGFQAGVLDYVGQIGAHEAEHVATLTSVITDLGGEPVAEAAYEFGYTNLTEYLAIAAALENTGVAAYTGAAQYLIDSDELLTAALTIHGNEARHASYLNLVNETVPFPDAFDAPLTPDEVLAIATPFFATGDGDAATEATPDA